ncbi:MAG: alpha/beta hydrolase [Pseudomonadales bacterium]|nr:alpha/beta hydrolase [Pseudomonadales bacterium]
MFNAFQRRLLLLIFCQLAGCSGFLFYPSKEWQYDPKDRGYDYQSISIAAEDGILLNAWLMPQRTETRKGAVIYFHGNAQNIGSHVAQVFWLTDAGYDVLLVDYRGFGHSEGRVDIDKNIVDIGSAMNFFFSMYEKDEKKYLLGQSIGAAMSGYVLATRPELRKGFDGIALDSGFAEYRRITRDVVSRNWITWVFQYPISWSMPGRYDLLDVIDKISPTPLLIIHGKKDFLVGFDHAEDLFAKAGRPKSMLWFDGPHIGAFLDEANRQALVNFYQYGLLQPEL